MSSRTNSLWFGLAVGGVLAAALILALKSPNQAAALQPQERTTVLTATLPPYLPIVVKNFSASSQANLHFANCRSGIGVPLVGTIDVYDITPMNFGWYVNWGTRLSPTTPTGMGYYHTISVKQDRVGGVYLPTYQITPTLDFSPTGLGPIVQANAGAVWLIGNEPDIISQSDTMPDMYAQIYHDAYHFIKEIDPTAKVAIGAVAQPTPVRLQYLDIVLSEYRIKYGTSMPTDIWNTHLYIIREVRNEWGAQIPPGIDVDTGRVYTLQDHIDSNELSALIVELRTWMKERGYQNKPLIVTEWGVLMPLWFLQGSAGLTQNDINNFLNNAVSYMHSTTDPNLGYPADGHRLVQQAALYSLNDDSTFEDGSDRWGSYLFNSTSPYTITVTGTYYKDVIAPNMAASVDLLPYQAFTDPRPLIISPTSTVSPTLNAMISNAGNAPPSTSVTVRFLDVTGGGSSQIGSDTLTPFTGCGTLREAGVIWPDLSPGLYSVRVEVDPDNQIQESIESNNVMTQTILVGTHGTYLPTVFRSYP